MSEVITIAGTLENWVITPAFIGNGKYMARGNVYNHATFDDGAPIHTSLIGLIDFENGWIKTRNSTYILGKPQEVDT